MDQVTEAVALTKMDCMIQITRLRQIKLATVLSPERDQRIKMMISASHA
jgi:hypothetical protein